MAEDVAALPFDADAYVPERAHEVYATGGFYGTALEVSLTVAGGRFSDVAFVQGGDAFEHSVNEDVLRVNVPLANRLAEGEVRYAEVRASVHSPAYESGRVDLTVQLRGLVSEGVEGSLSVEEDLAGWTYSGFADLLPAGDYSASLTLGVELFTLSAEGTLSLLPDVTRATLEGLLGGAETATAPVNVAAEGAAFLGAFAGRALIRIYGERINPFSAGDFGAAFLRETTIVVAPDFAREAVSAQTESFSLTVVYPPGADWRLDVVRPSPSWEARGTTRESDGVAGYRIGFRSFGSGAPRGGETIKRGIVFAGFYPEGYRDPENGLRARDGALTLSLAVSAVAEVPTGRVEFAATTRVSSRVDAASGGTVVYAGWLDSLAGYSEVSLRFAPPDGISNDGDVLRLFDLDSQGRLVWTPTLFADDDDFARHLDSRTLERYGFQSFLAAVDAYSADYLGALRLTAQIVFRASELAGRPKLPDGIPETGDIAGGYDAAGRANCVALGGRVDETPDPEFAALLGALYTGSPELYTRCADLDNYGSECVFGVAGCGDYFARVRDCNAQNRPSNLIDAAAQSANPNVGECGAVCEDGLSARGRDCNILTFYGQELRVDAASQRAVIGAENHLGSGDVSADFAGVRRNLWVMSVPSQAGGPAGIGGPLNAGNLAGIGNICRGGGAGWRLPSLSEAAGLVYPGADGGGALVRVEVTPDTTGIPGLESQALVSFPRNESGSAALGGRVISELVALSGGPRFALARWDGTGVRATRNASGAQLYCVRERSDYPALSDPAGLRANGVSRGLQRSCGD